MKKDHPFKIFLKQLTVCFLILTVVSLLLAWRLTESSAGHSMAESASSQSPQHSMQMSGEEDSEQKKKKAQEILGSPLWSQFNEIIKQRLDSRGKQKETFNKVQDKELESLSAQRKELLAALIEVDPKAALEQAISSSDQNQLSPAVVQNLEQEINGDGDFLVKIVMNHDPQTGEMIGSAIEREVVMEGISYQAFVNGRRESMPTKLNIPLHGIVVNGKMAVDESPLLELNPGQYAANGVNPARVGSAGKVALAGKKIIYFDNQAQHDKYLQDEIEWEARIGPVRPADAPPPPTGQALSSWTLGIKKLLVMKVDFSDKPGDPCPNAQSLMDDQVSPFYANNSFHKTSLQTTVTPLLRMPQPSGFYAGNNNFVGLLTDARNAAQAAGYNLNNYDLDMVANTGIFGWSGIAYVGWKGAEMNGEMSLRVAAHELGHNYGNWHANLWAVNDGNPISPNGSHQEYGDNFDAMGIGGGGDRHFNAAFKYNLNWLTDANVQTVTSSGTYRIFAHDTSVLAGLHALRINSGGLTRPDYWIEFKQLINNSYIRNGAVIHWVYGQSDSRGSELLDMHPATSNPDDAPLEIGESFSDPSRHFKITVLGKGNTSPESLDIKVDIFNGLFDFDADGKADISVYRPSNGIWYLLNSQSGFTATQFGLATDKIVPADYDGDGKTDVAVWRNGTWYLQRSRQGFTAVPFGQAGDIPVPADFDGDGKAELAVFRPANGTWYIYNLTTNTATAALFGQTGDIPQVGDFDADGKADISLYRPSNGIWYRINSSNNSLMAQQFGAPGDLPDAADYDGDGKADLAVFRPATGVWYLQQSSNGFAARQFGQSGDRPVAADFDGDGKADVAVFRSSSGTWYFNNSRAGFYAAQFGQSGDVPTESAFVGQ